MKQHRFLCIGSTAFMFFGLSLPGISSATLAQGRLESGSGQLPLRSEVLDVVIDRQHAETELEQTFRNNQDTQLEGRYRYQAPDGARVHGFAYWNGTDRIVGEVFEKETAQQVYEAVTGIGRDPGLLEESGNGGFSFRVFPIEPEEDKRVALQYGAALAAEGDVIEFRAPLSGAVNFTATVRIQDEVPVRGINSPTHHLEVDRQGPGSAIIRVGDRKSVSEDLVIQYQLDREPGSLLAAVHRDAGYDAYLDLSFRPPARPQRRSAIQKDITLVIDRSGSMSGDPLEQAKIAALQLIDRTRPEDRINVVAFDDQVESVFDRPVSLGGNDETAMREYIEGLGSRGGTDIALALEYAFARQHDDARPHFVLFLTDGQSSGDAALRAAQADDGTRVYTIGVGSGVNQYLLERLASEKRGAFTFVQSAQAIAPRMRALYAKLSDPLLINLRLESSGAELHDCYPKTLPDVFAGEDLNIRCRFRGEGDASVSLVGHNGRREVRVSKSIAVPRSVERTWVGRSWAGARVESLLQQIQLEGETEELKNSVINIALAYNLTTPYTSFLAIPESEISDDVRGAIDDARARKRQLLDSMPDAARLSRNAMPPGDPLLKVRAPADALSVTARFPFGLVKDLYFNPRSEHWECRFLVPNHVEDGHYDIEIYVTPAYGAPYITTIPYDIDSEVDGFDVETDIVDGEVHFRVEGEEALRQVVVALKEDPTIRVELVENDEGFFEGSLELEGSTVHDVVIVATDEARNEQLKDIEVVVP